MSHRIDILLVEDNANEAQLTLRALRKTTVVPTFQLVRDGVEALEFLLGTGRYALRGPEAGPRLILLDLKLPKIDGLELLQNIKATPRLRGIPVVVFTSSREERDIVESYRLGVNSYIVKPVNFDQLATAVQQVAVYWLQMNQPPLES